MATLIRMAIDRNGLEETKKTFKQRFVSARIDAEMSESAIKNEMTQLLGIKDFRFATISAWEHGESLPRLKYIEALSDILNVDPEYLVGLQDSKRKTVNLKNTNGFNMIKYDVLQGYDNEPVWCVNEEDQITTGFWALVDASRKCLTVNGNSIPFRKISFRVYNFISPYNFAVDSNLDMLDKDAVRSSEKVWVQGIGGNYESRKRLSGYYRYDDKTNSVVDSTGYMLSLDTYCVNWVAYPEQVIEPQPERLL